MRCSNHWVTWTEMMSEGYICVQPVTFWWPVKCSNHWTTWTEMMSEGYICVQPVTFWWPVRCSNHWTACDNSVWSKMHCFSSNQLLFECLPHNHKINHLSLFVRTSKTNLKSAKFQSPLTKMFSHRPTSQVNVKEPVKEHLWAIHFSEFGRWG